MIEIRKLSVAYGKKEVLKDLSANFEKGKITSLIGPNGCGKTTLLNAAVGIINKNKDSVFIDGSDFYYMKSKELAKKVAYLSQGKTVYDMTVENLVLHGRFPYTGYSGKYSLGDKEIAVGAMEKMGIAHLAKANVNTLSGGQKQNAFIAMALCQNTEYILMDEPTTYLDIANQTELVRTLKKLKNEGKGIVAVLHDIPLALTVSDSVAVMNKGEIVMQDTSEKIYESGIIKAVFKAEIKKTSENSGYFYSFDFKEG